MAGFSLICSPTFCLVNCFLLSVVLFLAKSVIDIAFSPTRHELMALSIISCFLDISMVNLGYDGYLGSWTALGNTLISLRELNQLVLA